MTLPIDNRDVLLTLDYNDLHVLLASLGSGDVRLNDLETEVAYEILDKLFEACDSDDGEAWLNDLYIADGFDDRPVGTIDLSLSCDDFDVLCDLLQREAAEDGTAIWEHAIMIAELGGLTSGRFDDLLDSSSRLRALAQNLLHRAYAYVPDTPPARALQLVYGTLSARWCDEDPRSVQQDLRLALLIALGAIDAYADPEDEPLCAACHALRSDGDPWCTDSLATQDT